MPTMQEVIGECFAGTESYEGDDDAPYNLGDDPEIGGFLGINFKKIGRGLKKIVKSPLVKIGATGAAFVFPPLAPVAAATVAGSVAGRIALNAKSKNKKKRRAARRVIVRTAHLAKRGDVSARRGLKILAAAGRKRDRLLRKALKRKAPRVKFRIPKTINVRVKKPVDVRIRSISGKRPPRWLVPWLKACCRRYPIWWKRPPKWLRAWLKHSTKVGWPKTPPRLKDVRKTKVYAPLSFSVTPKGRVLKATA